MDYGLGPLIETDEHYALLRHALTLNPKGTAIEFGVGKGESTAIIAAHMPVVGFGSVEGIPEDWRPEFPKGAFAFPLPTIDNVEIHDGWFEDVLPGFDFEALGHAGLIHCDADLYSSTATALKYCEPVIKAGTVIVFDEWHGFDGCEDHEQRAWREFADRTGITWNVVGHSFQQWSIRVV